jgi:hypothetical protein
MREEKVVAKRKSASSGKAKSTRSAKAKSAAANGQATATRPKAGGRELTGVEIGHVAGEVWAALEKNGGQTLAGLKKSVHAPPDLVVAAVGWLAREDKLSFITSGATVKIALRFHD